MKINPIKASSAIVAIFCLSNLSFSQQVYSSQPTPVQPYNPISLPFNSANASSARSSPKVVGLVVDYSEQLPADSLAAP